MMTINPKQGEICQGVIAFGDSLSECQTQLRSTLEDWILD